MNKVIYCTSCKELIKGNTCEACDEMMIDYKIVDWVDALYKQNQ
jgi:recombinational DNA repair protein RecR